MQYPSSLLLIDRIPSAPIAAAGLALALLLAPSAALAETLYCRVLGPDAGGATLGYRCNGPVPCSTDATCDVAVFGDRAVCQAFDERTTERLCRAECSTIVGCDETSDCARLGGATPQCVPFLEGSGEPSGLCVYPSLGITYCAEAPPSVINHFWTTCHTLPGGGVTSNYFDGDCDGDGCANGEDAAPCEAGEAPCVARTRGPLCLDLTARDAGVGPIDGGSDADAGTTTEPDASAPATDGGAAGEDAGPTGELDAGRVEAMDGGGGPPGTGFNGGGGCRCAIPGGGTRAPGGGLVLGLLALGTWARRRSASRLTR